MRGILLFLLTFNFATAFSQIPEDAIRYSWYIPNGSARNMAIGGAMGSLGGEITAPFVNPAGLAFYRNSEVVFSPGYMMNKNFAAYRDSNSMTQKNALNFGPSGVIIGIPNRYDEHKNSAIAFAFNKRTSFNNVIHYSGMNNYSSFSEQFAEEFAKSGLSIESVLYSNSPMPYTVAPALYTYLIDTVTVNGVVQVKAAPEYLLDSGKALLQQMNKVTKGGIYEWAFSLATKINEKWLFGGTLGIPVLNYRSEMTFTESDISGDTSNKFSSFTYTDNFTTYGSGINLKLGAIFRPKEYIRIGFAFHTPDLMVLKDTRTTTLTTNLENPVATYTASSISFTNNEQGQTKYQLNTAWKAMLSASYVFREIENVKRQKAFITADLEYVKHKSSRFLSNNENPAESEKSYYKALNEVIKDNYKGVFNFRIGGELKFNIIMARLGFAYYGNPYRDVAFKANNMMLSGGLGYRNNGFFVDLTYAYQVKKDVDLPYRLEDRANTFSTLKEKQGNILLTVGVKF